MREDRGIFESPSCDSTLSSSVSLDDLVNEINQVSPVPSILVKGMVSIYKKFLY